MGFRRKKNPRRVNASGRRIALRGILTFICGLVAVCGLVVGIVWAVSTGWSRAKNMQRFRVAEVRATGNIHLAVAEIVALSGVKAGDLILELDLIEISRRLTAQPWIREATVVRHLPSRLEIVIDEYKPSAAVHLDDFYLVDPQGEVFKRVRTGEAVNLPVITGLSRNDYLSQRTQSKEQLRQAVEVVSLFDGAFSQKEWEGISEVHLDVGRGISLITEKRGIEVVLGHNDYEAKIKILVRVVSALEGTGLLARRLDLASVLRTGNIVLLPEKAAASKTRIQVSRTVSMDGKKIKAGIQTL